MMLRACERMDPRAFFGKPWNALSCSEQLELLGYHAQRVHEEVSAYKKVGST
jgi:hypothetical protein